MGVFLHPAAESPDGAAGELYRSPRRGHLPSGLAVAARSADAAAGSPDPHRGPRHSATSARACGGRPVARATSRAAARASGPT